jgi:hypothetical protein
MMGQGGGSGCAGWAEGALGCWVGCWAFFYFFLISLYFVLFYFLHHFKSNSLLNARSTKSPIQENKSVLQHDAKD